eukprot:TRINITY_DN8571_c0_g1_i2.p1 TRINITY_DN8571_c0_g1~~TRINITY_DN8571_c0_g1_i2.p1  ORF type:complete len:196 (+),score=19.53 TRINITY_DN8571_c0_g1_i2:63-590(+)
MAAIEVVQAHWDAYYSQDKSAPEKPSTFAEWIAQHAGVAQLKEKGLIVDACCGNGRDALYFAKQGFSTLGIDRSGSAIDKLTQATQGLKDAGTDITFARHDIGDLNKNLGRDSLSRDVAVVYSRFALHAVPKETASSFLTWAASVCQRTPPTTTHTHAHTHIHTVSRPTIAPGVV